jgi:biopolymer transport protein ExbD
MLNRTIIAKGRRRNGRSRRARGTPRLKITSMMDILTVLLLFLLKSFVIDGEVATPPPGVELPMSSAEESPETSLVVAISREAILVGDEPVATIAEALAGDEPFIEALAVRLDAARERMNEIAIRRGHPEPPEPRITIQGDRDLEFQVLERVMATCSSGGFDQLSLAVIRDS